jgi:DNA-binding response OmpR family regulator
MQIVLIEDDPFYAEFVSKSLQRPGRTIHHFTTAEEGLVFTKDDLPEILIIDYKLPGMSGIDFFLKIKDRLKYLDHSKAIMMSALDDGRMVLSFIQKGVRDYVIKDEFVIESINAILEGRENEMLFFGTEKQN